MSSCSCHKTILDPEPRRLLPGEECWGRLLELGEQDGLLQATVAGLQIVLPLELGDQLKGLIGQRIAILRTDLGYRLRCLDGT
jgi:hypothetical protein